jgi:hypothetical protein
MSKFSGVLAAKREPEAPEQPATPQAAAKAGARPQTAKEPALRGRPPAKRSDPDFVQTTAYIRRDTHRDVKIALLNEGKGREYSEVVEELLAAWLKR